MNKKILIVVLAIISLVVPSNIPAFAQSSDISENKQEEVTSGLDNIDFEIDLSEGDYTESSLEEFYEHYLEITGEEYPRKIQTSTISSLPSLISPMGYVENRAVYKKVNVGYSRYIEVGCIVSVGVGAQTSWNSIVGGTTYAVAFSSGDFSWTTSAVTSTLSSNHNSIHFAGRGTATVTSSQSISIGLAAAGFSMTSSVGSTYYWRKAYTINETLNK